MREQIAEYFRIARQEGALRKVADGKDDADQILTLIREEMEKASISAEKCSCSDCFASGANKMKLEILSLLKDGTDTR